VAALAVSAVVQTEGGAGVCAAQGFRCGAAAAHIRDDGDSKRLDVAVVCSDRPAAAAGVFTRNTVKAAPVVISQLTLRRHRPVVGVVLNAGNANACTGPQGLRDALVMCATAAESLDADPGEVLVCSTGVIGRVMPMPRVTAGVRAACAGLSRDGRRAAEAIMTTDRRPKTHHARFRAGGALCTVGGMAKGAGMMHPDMATLLGIITTDAAVAAETLQQVLEHVTDDTFNCVTVDGDTSTNDTVLLLANGASGGTRLEGGTPDLGEFERCLHAVCESLAEQVVADAEGSTRHFRVDVTGAADTASARRAARTVAESPLVKTAIAGGDPNWGRIVAALGRSGSAFTLDRCAIAIGGLPVFRLGSPCEADLGAVAAALRHERVDIAIDLGCGEARGHAWGCELTADYVRINADYTT
jgi:glutamate N-acetyltransferase/amino-acid N-acetyltransferase